MADPYAPLYQASLIQIQNEWNAQKMHHGIPKQKLSTNTLPETDKMVRVDEIKTEINRLRTQTKEMKNCDQSMCLMSSSFDIGYYNGNTTCLNYKETGWTYAFVIKNGGITRTSLTSNSSPCTPMTSPRANVKAAVKWD